MLVEIDIEFVDVSFPRSWLSRERKTTRGICSMSIVGYLPQVNHWRERLHVDEQWVVLVWINHRFHTNDNSKPNVDVEQRVPVFFQSMFVQILPLASHDHYPDEILVLEYVHRFPLNNFHQDLLHHQSLEWNNQMIYWIILRRNNWHVCWHSSSSCCRLS